MFLVSENGIFGEVKFSKLFEKTLSFPSPELVQHEITLIQVLDNVSNHYTNNIEKLIYMAKIFTKNSAAQKIFLTV